jgi:hypothetical protein
MNISFIIIKYTSVYLKRGCLVTVSLLKLKEITYKEEKKIETFKSRYVAYERLKRK